MPSPLGHSLAGLLWQQCGRFKLVPESTYLNIFLILVFTNAPDLDFIPGLIAGAPNRYHHGISHSLGAGVFFAGLAGLVGHRAYQRGRIWFMVSFLLYMTHVFLDCWSVDTRPPVGVLFFWPLDDMRLHFDWPVFHSIERSGETARFFQSLCTLSNFKAVAREAGIFGLGFTALFLIRVYGSRVARRLAASRRSGKRDRI